MSNATTRLEDDIAAFGLTDAFDVVVDTARLGVANPDPRVFEAAARAIAGPGTGASPRPRLDRLTGQELTPGGGRPTAPRSPARCA